MDRGPIIALISVILVAAGFTVHSFKKEKTEQATVHTMTLHAACTKCKWHGVIDLGNRPGTCPDCKLPGVWPAEKCQSCGEIQPIDQDDIAILEARELLCRSCNKPSLQMIPTKETP